MYLHFVYPSELFSGFYFASQIINSDAKLPNKDMHACIPYFNGGFWFLSIDITSVICFVPYASWAISADISLKYCLFLILTGASTSISTTYMNMYNKNRSFLSLYLSVSVNIRKFLTVIAENNKYLKNVSQQPNWVSQNLGIHINGRYRMKRSLARQHFAAQTRTGLDHFCFDH